MKSYIHSIIVEQINKSKILLKMIPDSLDYPILETLSSNCKKVLKKNIERLEDLIEELQNLTVNYNNYFLRRVSDCYKINSIIEAFGISALHYVNPELRYINELGLQLTNEINFPIIPPSTACISMDYYFYFNGLNVIFVPVSESKFILHIVNLFHELGHCILDKSEEDIDLLDIYGVKNLIINQFTISYNSLLKSIKRQTQRTPKKLIEIIENFHTKWKSYWIDEILSDLFSIFVTGPSYAYAYFHLSTKISKDIYDPGEKHPSDYIRLYFHLLALEKLGYKDQYNFLQDKITNLINLMG